MPDRARELPARASRAHTSSRHLSGWRRLGHTPLGNRGPASGPPRGKGIELIERTAASRRHRTRIVIAVIAVWLLVGTPGATGLAAAQATPEAERGEPDQAACQIAPITTERLLTALDTATPGPLATLTLETLPAGEPVDAATLAAITATVETALECRNAGYFARAYALFTDRLIGQLFGGRDTVPPEIVRALMEPPQSVRRRSRVELVELSTASLLPDGRVGAVAVTANATHTFSDYLVFTEAAGRWLIDEAIVIVAVAAEGTPVP